MAIKNILGNPNVRNYIAATKQPVNVMNNRNFRKNQQRLINP